MVIQTREATMGDDLLYPPKQQNLSFLDSPEMTRRSEPIFRIS